MLSGVEMVEGEVRWQLGFDTRNQYLDSIEDKIKEGEVKNGATYGLGLVLDFYRETAMLPFVVVRALGDTVADENFIRVVVTDRYESRTSALLASKFRELQSIACCWTCWNAPTFV